MKNLILAVLLILCTLACGGGPTQTSTQTSTPAPTPTPTPTPTPVSTPSLWGQWEIVFTSTEGNPGQLFEIDLGTPEAGTPPAPGLQYSVLNGSDTSYLISGSTLTSTTDSTCGVNGNLVASATGNDVQFTYGPGGIGTGTGTYSKDVITGTYTEPAPCVDKGTFIATTVTTGGDGSTYSGNVLFTDGTHDSMYIAFGTIQSPGDPFSFGAVVEVSGTDNYSSTNPGGLAGGGYSGASFTLSVVLTSDSNFQSIITVYYAGFFVTQNNAAFFPMAAVGDLVLYEQMPATSCSPFQPTSTCSPATPFVGTLTAQ